MKLTIKHKLTLFVTSASLLCYLLTSLFFFDMYAKTIKKNAMESSASEVASVAATFDLLQGKLLREAKPVAENADVLALLRQSGGLKPDERTRLIAGVDRALDDFVLQMNREVAFVEIVPRDASADLRLSTGVEYGESPYDFAAIAAKTGEGPSAWFIRSPSRLGEPVWVLIVADPQTGEKLGALAVHMQTTLWSKLFQNASMNLYMVDEAHQTAYRQGEVTVDPAFFAGHAGLFAQEEGVRELRVNRSQMIVSFQSTADGAFQMVGFIDTKTLFSEMFRTGTLIVAVCTVWFLLTVLFSSIVSHRITASIFTIERQIGRVMEGEFHENQRLPLLPVMNNRNLADKYRVVFIYVAIVMIPMVVSIVLMNRIAGDSIETQLLRNHLSKVELIARKMDMNVREYGQQLDYLFGDKALNASAARYLQGQQQREQFERDAEESVARLHASSFGEIAVSLYDNDRNSLFRTGCRQPLLPEELKEMRQKSGNGTTWFPPLSACGTNWIAFGKMMLALSNYDSFYFLDTMGYFVLQINEQLFQQMYHSELESGLSHLYVMDADGRIVSDPVPSNIGMQADANRYATALRDGSASGMWWGDGKGEKTAYLYSRMEQTGWLIVAEIGKRKLGSQVPGKTTYGALSVTVNLLLLSALLYWFINRITRHIRKLNGAIAEVAGGNLVVETSIRTGDEIQNLAEGFNAMVRRLSELMNETYQLGVRRKEAELNSLQAQINPHFLYNTLESINWEAMLLTNGPNKVSEMVTALSDLLRLSINKGREIVTFQEEIDHVKNYLILQKERYADKFEVEWNVDPRLYEYRTLKLILQPLVENAIYHGLELKEGTGVIRIGGKLEEDGVRVTIEDDGLGMSAGQLAQVRQSLLPEDAANRGESGKRGAGGSIGISNVHERIQLYYGEFYGIEVESEPNAGTRVTIRLPLLETEEHHDT